MYLHECIHHRIRHLAAQLRCRCHLWWKSGVDDYPFPSLHDIEGHTQNGKIIAEEVRFGGQCEDRMYFLQEASLALHVVRLGWHWPQWWAAQYAFPIANLQQIGQVGSTRWKLPHLQRPLA